MNTRLKLAAILVLFEIASYFALSITPRDDMYYLVAGAFSFFVIPCLARCGSDQLIIDLIILALFMLVFQFVGFVIYHARLPVEIYNWAIHVILFTQFLRLLITRKLDGVDQHNHIVYLLCRPNFERDSGLC